jgi:prepilin signal peptidase PulO-like enzyme (type II secretory pathway)
MIVADPWYDYLAFPLAPLVLCLQFGALFLPRWWQRVAGSLTCAGAIAWMSHYVSSLEVTDEGVNFGEILLAGLVGFTVLLLGVAAVSEVVRLLAHRVRARRKRG